MSEEKPKRRVYPLDSSMPDGMKLVQHDSQPARKTNTEQRGKKNDPLKISEELIQRLVTRLKNL